jgi:hypothetical protein
MPRSVIFNWKTDGVGFFTGIIHILYQEAGRSSAKIYSLVYIGLLLRELYGIERYSRTPDELLRSPGIQDRQHSTVE